MKREPSVKRELLGAALSVAVSLIGALDLLGHPARLVHVLTIFAGGLGAGVALGRAIDRARADRRASAADAQL